MYQLTVESGRFNVLQHSLTGITQDRRLQLLLIAFCFGAFFEGAAGFGTPVAVTAALLIGLGFKPLQASGLSLIANTAPVAFGALGTPIIALAKVTGFSEITLGAMAGRILDAVLRSRAVLADLGLRRLGRHDGGLAGHSGGRRLFRDSAIADLESARAVAGQRRGLGCLHDLPDWLPASSGIPSGSGRSRGEEARLGIAPDHGFSRSQITRAWVPWIILSVIVFRVGHADRQEVDESPEKTFASMASWQTPPSKITNPQFPVTALNNLVLRVPPVVPKPTKEPAVFGLNWLSATGTGILLAAFISGLIMGLSFAKILAIYGRTMVKVRFSLLTIAAMMAIGMLTRYSGLDATMGLAFARTGHLYPFFGTLLGWLGVALTGSDTSSNVLFGSLQKITAQQVNVSPALMAAANSAGGVMGKMIDAQSIVVASTATQWYGHEGDILRYVFWHSIALAALVGIFVFLMAYVYPFTQMVLR